MAETKTGTNFQRNQKGGRSSVPFPGYLFPPNPKLSRHPEIQTLLPPCKFRRFIKTQKSLKHLSLFSSISKTQKFETLPPLKRFRLLQQQKMEENKENNGALSIPLPVKKRKESREPLPPLHSTTKTGFPTTTTTYCLPAKKRVWALPPELVSSKPLSPFDLNLEYKPALNEELGIIENKKKAPFENSADKADKEVKNAKLEEIRDEEEGNEEDEDGILCTVCQSTDGDPVDPIVFCDGCNLMVHVTCYGNPLIEGIPEGEWFCTQCLCSKSSSRTKAFSCCLCTTKGGALKPTTDLDGSWAHLLCALFVPEVFFKDPDGREGIDCSKVPKRRWEGKCYVCKSRGGCVIECSEPKCPLAFHATCGLNEGLCIVYKERKKKKETIVAGFCKSHTKLWEKQQQSGKFKIVARE